MIEGLPNHPGIDSKGNRIPARSFEGFRTFVNTRGLNPVTAEQFSELLSELFTLTGKLWLPGYCMRAVEVTEHAGVLSDRYFPGSHVSTMLHLGSFNTHTWTRLEIPRQPLLIIDPAGVINRNSEILPYFGPTAPCIIQNNRFIEVEAVYIDSKSLTAEQAERIKAANKVNFPSEDDNIDTIPYSKHFYHHLIRRIGKFFHFGTNNTPNL